MIVEEFWAWSGDEPHIMTEDALGWPRIIFLTEEDVQRHLATTTRSTMDIGNTVSEYNWVFGGFANYFALGEMTVMQVIRLSVPHNKSCLTISLGDSVHE